MAGTLVELGPWLAIAGLGALHGLSPAGGWLFAAERGLCRGSAARAGRALLPIGLGHAAAALLVAWALGAGLVVDRALAQRLAGAALLVLALLRLRRGRRSCRGEPAGTGHAGLALWSGLMATAHGTGLMLVPALAPLCLSDTPAGALMASGSLLMAAAAMGVHLAAMLLASGTLACAVCRGAARYPALAASAPARHACTAMLVITAVALLARA